MEGEEKNKLFTHFHGHKEKLKAIFPLFMFCVQSQHHHGMEGVNNNIHLSMLFQKCFARVFFSIKVLLTVCILVVNVK
jgi:hypothetical protein